MADGGALSYILGPAVVIYASSAYIDYIDKKRKSINAAEILLLEIRLGVEELKVFLKSIRDPAYVDPRIDPKSHGFLIPVDDAFDKVLRLVEEPMMLLPYTLVSDIMKYYRNDRCLNEVLRQLSDHDFVNRPEGWKREQLKITEWLTDRGSTHGAKVIHDLDIYLQKARRQTIVWRLNEWVRGVGFNRSVR